MKECVRNSLIPPIIGALAVGVLCAQAPAANTGILRVEVMPAALLYLEGQLVGEGPATSHQMPLQVGDHTVHIVHADYLNWVRVIRVKGNQTTTIKLMLEDRGVRKAPGSTGGPGVSAGGLASAALDQGVKDGIDFLTQGDLEPAIKVLNAAVNSLAGVNLSQRAVAYFYLGNALAELDNPDLARQAFGLARRLDGALRPKPTEFSRWIISLWDEPKPAAGASSLDLTALLESFQSPTTGSAGPDSDSPAAVPVTVSARVPVATEFIFASGAVMTVNVVALGETKHCPGALRIDRDNRILEWAAVDSGCLAGFRVNFAEVRSPAAAPRGGLLLQFRSERPAMTLMPLPDADLVEPGVERMRFNDLPVEAQVNLRRANREIVTALGRVYADSLFGMLTEVSLEELSNSARDFEGGFVRTQGKLSRAGGNYTLSDGQRTLRLKAADSTIAALLQNQFKHWVDQEMLVGGTFSRFAVVPASRGRNEPTTPQFWLALSKIELVSDLASSGAVRAVSLEDLVKGPPLGRRETVTVVGQFRGFNYYGDFPEPSRRNRADWVIKDDLFAVWVVGKLPIGTGFSLVGDAELHSQSWVSVTGTVEERNSFQYLHANRVELSSPPSELRAVKAPARRSGSPNTRPDIFFVFPIPGKEELSRDADFGIQFTKPMDEESFNGRVQLRYADGPPGDFSRLGTLYVDSKDRYITLRVYPGVALQAGRTLECLLLPGIKDVDGQLLVGTDSSPRILRWKVKGR